MLLVWPVMLHTKNALLQSNAHSTE